MHNCNHDICWKMADCSPELSESDLNKKTDLVIKWWNNNIMELGYHGMLLFVSGKQINYLPQSLAWADNWSTNH